MSIRESILLRPSTQPLKASQVYTFSVIEEYIFGPGYLNA